MKLRGILINAVVITLCSLLFAQEDQIFTEGFGEGVNRAEALMAAKRDAVEKGIGMILISQTEIENFQVKRDQVITKTVGTVKNYEVTSENTVSDGTIQIKIKALLSKTSMRSDLAAFQILIESMDKPKIMVIIQENNIGNSEPTNQIAENSVIKFLKDPYGFEIIDPTIAASIKSSQQKMALLAGDAAAAAAIGNQYGAEVLVTGSAVSRKAEEISQSLGGMVSVQADVTLRVINCTTGRIIGADSDHAARVHISPHTAGNQAIGKASEKTAQKLIDMVIKDWQDQLNNGLSLSVSVQGVNSFRTKNALVQTLRTISGISAVRERSWDAQSSVLSLDIQYKGNPNGFCERIDGFKMKSGGGSIAVTGVNGLNISLVTQAM